MPRAQTQSACPAAGSRPGASSTVRPPRVRVPAAGRARSATAFIALALLLTACGGRSLNKNAAQELVARSSLGALNKEEIYIDSVTQTGERNAIVEARLVTAFRFEKAGGRWIIKEVRVGRGEWESLDEFLRALNIVKTEDTQRLLERIAEALQKYKEKNGALPDFKDFVSLSDALNPDYLMPLVRSDPWHHPLMAQKVGPATIRLESAGPDGKFGTSDDIVLTRTY